MVLNAIIRLFLRDDVTSCLEASTSSRFLRLWSIAASVLEYRTQHFLDKVRRDRGQAADDVNEEEDEKDDDEEDTLLTVRGTSTSEANAPIVVDEPLTGILATLHATVLLLSTLESYRRMSRDGLSRKVWVGKGKHKSGDCFVINPHLVFTIDLAGYSRNPRGGRCMQQRTGLFKPFGSPASQP